MVNQQQPPPEQDVITQEQQKLDEQQGITPPVPQYVTAEQMQRMLGEQARGYERQLAGLQSKLDTGLNAIRRDTQAQATAQAQRDRQAWLATLDDERRQAVLDSERFNSPTPTPPGNGATEAQQPSPQAPAPTTDAAAQWEAVYQMVRNMGVDPRASGIDYTALTQPGLDDNTRQQRFFTSLWTVKGTTAPRGAPAAPQQVRTTPNPPVEQQAPAAGGYRNIEDVYDAFITGRITDTQYREQARRFGVAV